MSHLNRGVMNIRTLSAIAATVGCVGAALGAYEWYVVEAIQVIPFSDITADDRYFSWPLYVAATLLALACFGYVWQRNHRLVLAVNCMLVVLLPAWWFVFGLRAKLRYDGLVGRLTVVKFAVTPMDPQTKTFLSEVQSNWTCKTDRINGPIAEAVKLAGLDPSVRGVIQMFNYQIPSFCWVSRGRNIKVAAVGMFKESFCKRFTDRTFYVSDDGHHAFVWSPTNVLFLVEDHTNGLRDALYLNSRMSIK